MTRGLLRYRMAVVGHRESETMASSDALQDGPQDLPAGTARPGQTPISWMTRLLVGLDVAVQRKSPWVSMPVCASILAAVLFAMLATLLFSGTSRQVMYAVLMMYVAVVWFVTGWTGKWLAYRRHGRPARPDEVAALRRHARPGTWPHVRTAAARWQQGSPRYPITIAVTLNWEDKAARKVRATMPPTVTGQAAVRAMAIAFE